MSENEHRGIRDLSQYDSMPTEALEQILRADAETPAEQESDIELILYIMEVLSRREKENQQSGKTAQQSWESFQQHYLPEQELQKQNMKKSGRPWLRRMIACAAAVILILCIPVSSRALSLEELWDIVARWAKETFSFVSGDNSEVSEPNSISEEGFTSLQDALIKSNRDASLVPTWIPDGYELDTIEKTITPEQEIYIAHYVSDNGYFTFRVQTYLSAKPQNIEIGKDITEIYSIGVIDYYISSNANYLQVMWNNSGVEYIISGDISLDIAKKMVDSIGKE